MSAPRRCAECGFEPGLGEPDCGGQRDELLARAFAEAWLDCAAARAPYRKFPMAKPLR